MKELQDLVRSEWQRETECRLAALRSIPSTGMRWFLDRYDALGAGERDLLLNVLS